MSLRRRLARWIGGTSQIIIRRGRTGPPSRREKREEKGTVLKDYSWTDRAPHPPNLYEYERLNKDPEVATAITVLTDMVAGVGFYTEMPEDTPVPDDASDTYVHAHKETIDAFCERVNLDEVIQDIVRIRYEKGFCPVEILEDYSLKLLPPETFYIYRTPRNQVYKYTQEIGRSLMHTTDPATGDSIPCVWEGADLNNILVFVRKGSPTNPYGEALVEPIIRQLETRDRVNDDFPDVVHKQAYPFRAWIIANAEKFDSIYDEATEKEPDEDIFIGNVKYGDELEIIREDPDPRFDISRTLEHMDFQISEGLFAPLLMYLRNATEASATAMLEAIDRNNQGDQRYLKRRIEKHVFAKLVRDPVPRLMWGAPKTGLEEVSLTDMATLINVLIHLKIIDRQGAGELIRKMGIPLPEYHPPEEDDVMLPPPNGPGMMSPELETSLTVLEASFHAKTMTFTEAIREGDQLIKVYVDKLQDEAIRWIRKISGDKLGFQKLGPMSQNHFRMLRSEYLAAFKKRLVPAPFPVEPVETPTYKVSIEP